MKKRVGEVEEFEFEPLSDGSQLHMTIAIAGWLTDQNKGYTRSSCFMYLYILCHIIYI